MDSFIIEMRENDIIYHGSNTKISRLKNIPTWFAKTEKIATKYGSNLHRFKLNNSVKLIDIANMNFHNDFMAKINTYFYKLGKHDSSKSLILLPLGLPNFQIQSLSIDKTKVGLYPENRSIMSPNDKKLLDIIEYYVQYFGGRHRLSLERNGTNYDVEMVKIMMELYPQYDGYICELLWPSYHQGGFLDPEICLF